MSQFLMTLQFYLPSIGIWTLFPIYRHPTQGKYETEFIFLIYSWINVYKTNNILHIFQNV